MAAGKELSDIMTILNICENREIEQCQFHDAAVTGQSDDRKR